MQKLYATGNTYDINLEVKILDDNPARATTAGTSSLTGEKKYYSVYTNPILEKIENNGEYALKPDDYIIVTVNNTNITIGMQLKNFFYKLIGRDTSLIGTSASALVLNDGSTTKLAEEVMEEHDITTIPPNNPIKPEEPTTPSPSTPQEPTTPTPSTPQEPTPQGPPLPTPSTPEITIPPEEEPPIDPNAPPNTPVTTNYFKWIRDYYWKDDNDPFQTDFSGNKIKRGDYAPAYFSLKRNPRWCI